MSGSDEKKEPLESSSLSSAASPSQQSLDLSSLVGVFGALENALLDVKTLLQLHEKNARDRHGKSTEHHDKLVTQINNMHLSVVKLVDAFFANATAEGITLGATVDARMALDRARAEFDKTRERLEVKIDESQKFLTHKRSADEMLDEFPGLQRAPRLVRLGAAYLVDLGWKYCAKFAVSTLAASGALKLLWDGIAPFLPGAH